MAVTNAMEKTRLALHHVGKILFAQSTELMNPSMNRGLPPSLAATDPSHNYHTKGIDIHTAAYVGELGYLANPVSTHVQSAEMHNQAVKYVFYTPIHAYMRIYSHILASYSSLALISARATINSLEVLSMLTASYLYALCQALDLRALQVELQAGIDSIVRTELTTAFGSYLTRAQLDDGLFPAVSNAMDKALETTSTMDCVPRMQAVAAASTTPIVDFLTTNLPSSPLALSAIPTFRASVSSQASALLQKLRVEYLGGAKGPAPASPYLGKTKPVYEYVRVTLGVHMHGSENLHEFERGAGVEDGTIGGNISLIYEAVRDGKIRDVVAGVFESL